MSGQLRGRCEISCSIPESYRTEREEYGSGSSRSWRSLSSTRTPSTSARSGRSRLKIPVLQADKVRPVDDGSGTGSCANSFSYITEKLQVPTADLVISTISTLASSYSGKLGAWIVDEKSVFRQLPVAPESRAVAVVALCAPDTGRVAYFVMYGNPFRLSPSVYNYNHRARALTMMLVQDLRMIARNCFDDRFGVSPRELVEEEVSHVCHICHLLGIGISPKTQYGPNVDILGIVFDFDRGCLGVKPDRTRSLAPPSCRQEEQGNQRGNFYSWQDIILGGTDEPSWVRSESASNLRPASRTSRRTSGRLSGHGFGFSSPMLA